MALVVGLALVGVALVGVALIGRGGRRGARRRGPRGRGAHRLPWSARPAERLQGRPAAVELAAAVSVALVGLLRDRENVKVVSERLGHANVTITLTTYSHVMPGDQRQAAARFAALVAGAGA